MIRTAVISDCGRYRYRLFRGWGTVPEMKIPVLWIMLNPSTADAEVDDPTIRRCIAFSNTWGYGSMWVGNLYAFRSTDPATLWGMAVNDACGPENSQHLYHMALESAQIVCAWGAGGGTNIPLALPVPTAGGIVCLGTTKKHGAPRHPLYLKSTAERQPFHTDARR